MLGGRLQLAVLRMEDVARVDLSGFVDLIQLAKLAERHVCDLHGVDVSGEIKYIGKQHVQRVFGDMLSQGQQFYIMRDGFDTLLDGELLQVVLARATQAWIYVKGEPVELRLR